ncbi:transcription elongation factor A protein 1 [Striga asiatica]|uniref:Transcription elongation factor A protein 1 n=1 Tax=Striga asiatica TaxID=4170 RepID=A0A5A7PRL3_STRAF|nr:transcription elongation factor A protein 1 [Striga asiatica]
MTTKEEGNILTVHDRFDHPLSRTFESPPKHNGSREVNPSPHHAQSEPSGCRTSPIRRAAAGPPPLAADDGCRELCARAWRRGREFENLRKEKEEFGKRRIGDLTVEKKKKKEQRTAPSTRVIQLKNAQNPNFRRRGKDEVR